MDRRAYEDKRRPDRSTYRIARGCDGCGATVILDEEQDRDLALCTACRKQLAQRAAWRRKQAVRG